MQQPPNPYPQFQQPSPQQWQQQPPMPPQQQWNPQPPPYQPQQYQQPPQYQPPMQPRKKNLRKRLWLLVVAVFVIAIIMGLASRGQNQQPAPTTQATQRQTTQAPTQPPAKPTPQVSIQSQMQSIVQMSGAAYVGGATVTYDASAKYAHVFENFPVTGDNNLDVSRIKQDAFAIQKAIWQAHVISVDSVQIIFNDATSQQRLATCEVERTTAAKLSWVSMTNDQAWSSYDSTWLSPSL